MKRDIEHQIDIQATPAAVWAVLTDTDAYSDWNPFIHRLSGELRAGSKLTVKIAPVGGRAMTFKPTVLSAEDARELRWLGRLLAPRILDGEHRFRLQPLPDGGTRFTQSENFHGLLVRPLGGRFEKTRLGFEAMNHALKRRAEAITARA